MSAYYAEHGKPEVRKYKLHGRTKQSQKNECDINKLLERSARQGGLSHLDKYQAKYGDYSKYDFEEHTKKIAEMASCFEQLPAETKREFNQSPDEYFAFVTNPQNVDDLKRLLPEIANRGDYFPTITEQELIEKTAPKAPQAPQEPQAAEQGTQDVAPEKPPTGEEG